MSIEAIKHYEAALNAAFPQGASGEAFEHWNKARIAIEAAEKQEPVTLRRGDVLRCIETDELCTVWATSATHKTLVKWSGNDFSDYTAEQIGELFWLEPESSDVEIAAEQSDNYAAFHAGVRFARAHPPAAQRQWVEPNEREQQIIMFAVHRFMGDAYAQSTAAAQDHDNRYFKPGAVDAFYKDAKDAEALIAKLKEKNT